MTAEKGCMILTPSIETEGWRYRWVISPSILETIMVSVQVLLSPYDLEERVAVYFGQ